MKKTKFGLFALSNLLHPKFFFFQKRLIVHLYEGHVDEHVHHDQRNDQQTRLNIHRT